MIVALLIGTARVAWGPARATISTVSAVANAIIGRWRRHPGRSGATEGASAGSTNADRSRARPRWRLRYQTIRTRDAEQQDQQQRGGEAHGTPGGWLPSVVSTISI